VSVLLGDGASTFTGNASARGVGLRNTPRSSDLDGDGVSDGVVIGRSVATVAEICFAAQWAIILYQLGTMTGADTTLNAAWVIVPLILIAECFSWYAVLTTHYLGNAIENSIWAVGFFVVAIGLCRLWPEFDGPVRVVLAIAISGIAAYLAFLMTIDVPMYLSRWRASVADGSKRLRPLEGFRDVSTRWVVTLAREGGEATLAERRKAAREKRLEAVAQSPMVRAVLDRFPGAEIVAVRDRETDVPPTPEES